MKLSPAPPALPPPAAREERFGLDPASARAQQHYLEGGAKDGDWWQALDGQLELLARAAMRSGAATL